MLTQLPMAQRIPKPSEIEGTVLWWVFKEILRWEPTKLTRKPQRFLVMENTRILKAADLAAAYEKAHGFAREEYPMKTTGGVWRFVGISMLLPIYDELEDGAEIFWSDRGWRTKASIDGLCKSKQELLGPDKSPSPETYRPKGLRVD